MIDKVDYQNTLEKGEKMYKYLLIIFLCLLCFPAEGAPKLVWEEVNNVSRTNTETQTIKHVFLLYNKGDSTLEISRVRKSCDSCSSINLSEKIIQPGAKAKLEVEVTLLPGQSEKKTYIFIESNDPEQSILQLPIESKITSGIIYPAMVNFGKVAENSSATKTAEIYAIGDRSFKITDIKWGSFIEDIKVEKLEEGKKYRLEIISKPQKFAKSIQDYIKVYTDYPDFEEINIRLHANITSAISVSPEEIIIPNSLNIPMTRYLLIKAADNVPLKIENVEIPDSSSMKWEISSAGQNSYRIKLSNIQVSDMLKGKNVKIFIGIPEKKEIVIPFRLLETED